MQGCPHLLDVHADYLTIYFEFNRLFRTKNKTNVKKFFTWYGLNVNIGKTHIKFFWSRCTQLSFVSEHQWNWCTNFKFLRVQFDRNKITIMKTRKVSNNWKYRYQSIDGKIAVIKLFMLVKLTHVAMILPNLTSKQSNKLRIYGESS